MSKHKNIDKINNIYIMSAIVYIQYISLNCILVSKIQENSMQLIELYIKCREFYTIQQNCPKNAIEKNFQDGQHDNFTGNGFECN